MILYEKRCTINIYKKDFKSPLLNFKRNNYCVYIHTDTIMQQTDIINYFKCIHVQEMSLYFI